MGRTTSGALGERAEQVALDFLLEHDLALVCRNFRQRGGEIDLIMLDGDCLTFVEVRYRQSAKFTSPAHTVDHRKQRKIIRTAALFVAKNRRFALQTMRFDVVSIEGANNPGIEWIRDAFRPNDSTL